jgi:hypothetical protein
MILFYYFRTTRYENLENVVRGRPKKKIEEEIDKII